MSAENKINQPTTSKSNPIPRVTDVQCKKCFKNLKTNSILKHLTQSRKQNCISIYSEEEINAFRKNSKAFSKGKKSESDAKRYENKKTERNSEIKVKNKEYSKMFHGNDLQKYKESCEEISMKKNSENAHYYQTYFGEKIEKLKKYIIIDSLEREVEINTKFNVIQKSIEETYEELDELIDRIAKEVKDEKENWDSVAKAFSTLFRTYETSDLRWYDKPEGKLMIDQKWDAMKTKLENDLKIIQKEEVDFENICKGCGKSYQLNSILTHLGLYNYRQCREKYTNDELDNLRRASKERTKFKTQIWRETNKEYLAKQKAETYRIQANIVANAKENAEHEEAEEKFEKKKELVEKIALGKYELDKRYFDETHIKEIQRFKEISEDIQVKEQLQKLANKITEKFQTLNNEIQETLLEVRKLKYERERESLQVPWNLKNERKLSELLQKITTGPTPHDREPRQCPLITEFEYPHPQSSMEIWPNKYWCLPVNTLHVRSLELIDLEVLVEKELKHIADILGEKITNYQNIHDKIYNLNREKITINNPCGVWFCRTCRIEMGTKCKGCEKYFPTGYMTLHLDPKHSNDSYNTLKRGYKINCREHDSYKSFTDAELKNLFKEK